MSFLKQSNVARSLLLGSAIVIIANVFPGKSTSGLADMPTQDVGSLDRRISLLEQRFYSLEASINRLQQATLSQRRQSSQREQDVNLIRDDVQRLSLRLNEVECGVLKLDERTTASRKSAAGRSADPCRLNPEMPVRLRSGRASMSTCLWMLPLRVALAVAAGSP